MKLLSKRQALLWAVFALGTALLFQACKKNFETSDLLLDSNVRDAKSWYNEKFKLNGNSGKATASVQPTGLNFTQIITPDWENALTSKRYDDDIFEVPVDNPGKFGIGLKDITNTVPGYKPENSRTTFLLIKNAGGYRAFVMTVIGDDDYLKGDKTKLEQNRYGKHDPKFSGMLLYYTPEGKYINHHQYKDGKLLTKTQAFAADKQTLNTKQAQAKKTMMREVEVCTDFYSYYQKDDGTYSTPEYSYTSCKTFYVDDEPTPDYSGNNNTGSTQTSGSGNPPPAPVEKRDCDAVSNKDVSAYKRMVYDNGPGDPGDGGFPEPNPDCPTSQNQPSSTNNANIYNKVKDPCLYRLVEAARDRDIVYNINASMNKIFKSSASFDLYFEEAKLPYDIDGDTKASGMLGKIFLMPDGVTIDRIASLDQINVTIRLNSSTLPNASEEYVTATILHEALHAYFRMTRSQEAFDHYSMVKEYIPWFDAALKSIYPKMDEADRVALAYGGLMQDVAFTMGDQNAMKSLYGAVNDVYKRAKVGTPCH